MVYWSSGSLVTQGTRRLVQTLSAAVPVRVHGCMKCLLVVPCSLWLMQSVVINPFQFLGSVKVGFVSKKNAQLTVWVSQQKFHGQPSKQINKASPLVANSHMQEIFTAALVGAYIFTPSLPRVINFKSAASPSSETQGRIVGRRKTGVGGSICPWVSKDTVSPEILHHTVWRIWLFIVYSDDNTTRSHYLTILLCFLFERSGECTFWTWEWKG